VACAQAGLAALGLDLVTLVPAGAPPHKPVPGDPGPEHRLEMCCRAVTGDERLEVSGVELRRAGPSFTVDTLAALHAERPEDELTFIAGGDMAAALPRWREPERVLELARFAVAQRPGTGRDEIERALAGLRGRDRVVFFDMAPVEVSSTMVRAAVAEGSPWRWLVPDAVGDYIEAEGLYGAREAA